MKDKLSLFGESYIKSVRDNTLFVLEGIISGHMKGTLNVEMHDKIKEMSPNDIQLLKDLAYRIVDLSLHNTLFMFEENTEWGIINDEGELTNLTELSDGLSGELYTDDGWIRKFSEYPPSKGL